MKYLYLIVISILCISQLFSQNLATCTEEWCFDKDGNEIKELRFDPNTIKWPMHFTGDSVKNEDWIHVRYSHHDQIDVVSLKEYRSIIGDSDFCENGVKLHDAFGCEYGNSGKPRFVKAPCSLVGVSHEEREVKFGVGSCFKKIIDWTVIDWCTYDPKKDTSPDNDDLYLVKDLVNGYSYYSYNSDYGKLDRDGAYHYQQIIKIGDVEQPEILHSDKVHLNLGNDCNIQNYTIGNKAIDVGACPSENFSWSVTLYKKGEKPEKLKYNTIGSDSIEVTLEDLTAGEYRLLWRVNDGCNNPQEAKHIIYVEDRKAPTIHCKGSFSVGVGTPGDPITVWASDFVKSVVDNCTVDEDILVSFEKDEVVSSLDLTCEEHLGEADIQIFATDEEGNQSYCLVKSKFSSNDPECQRDVTLSGILSTSEGSPLANKTMAIHLSNADDIIITTDATGRFSLNEKLPLTADISLSLTEDLLVGNVSTFDLVAVQKHVLKDEMIEDMYRFAAADINMDGDITSEDVSILRSYLLGIRKFEKVLGNRLVDIKTGQSSKNILITEDVTDLQLSVIVAGDVVK